MKNDGIRETHSNIKHCLQASSQNVCPSLKFLSFERQKDKNKKTHQENEAVEGFPEVPVAAEEFEEAVLKYQAVLLLMSLQSGWQRGENSMQSPQKRL